MSKKILALLAIMAILCFGSTAIAENVSQPTDIGAAGELRGLLQDDAGTGQTYTFDAGVNPSLNPANGPIAVGNWRRTLQGNGAAMNPSTAILGNISGLGADYNAINSYLNTSFSTDLAASLSEIDSDSGRTAIMGNNTRVLYWYSSIDPEDPSKNETKGNGNYLSLNNLLISSGKVDLGMTAIHGGGVLGAYNNLSWKISQDINHGDIELSSLIGNINNTIFQGIEVSSTAKLDISGGGGVLGAASTAATENWNLDSAPDVELTSIHANAQMGDVKNSLFRDISVSAANDKFSGGGVIGVMAENSFTGTIYSTTPPGTRSGPQRFAHASLGEISNNLFQDIEVSVSKLNGGGVVGLSLSPATTPPAFGDVKNNIFSDITINAGKAIEGGGIIGMKVFSPPATSAGIVSIKNNLFNNISINVFDPANPAMGGDLQGGGIIGLTLFSGIQADASLVSLNSLVFNNVSIKAGLMEGGGLIGISAGAFDYNTPSQATGASASINSISNTLAMGTKVEAFAIQGGGLVGVSAGTNGAGAPALARVGAINNSAFINNSFTAIGSTDPKEPVPGDIWGGIIYSGGNVNITDSVFANNNFSAAGTVYSSAIALDTAFNPQIGFGYHSLNLTATDGQTTLIADNLNNPSSTIAGIYIGSLKLGSKEVPDPENPGEMKDVPINLPSQGAAMLEVAPIEGNSLVALYNPLQVDLTDSRADDQSQSKYSFTMVKTGQGQFIWGGHNEILLHQDAIPGLVKLYSGSTVLVNDFSLNALNSDFALYSGAGLLMAVGDNPYAISANSILLEAGSTLGLADDQRFYSSRQLNQGDILLSLKAGQSIVKDSTLKDSGQVEVGFYDYSYSLAWAGDDLVFGQLKRRENTARGAVSALTAPGAIATQLPGSRQVLRRINSALNSNGWQFDSMAGLSPIYQAAGEAAQSPDVTNPFAMWVTPSYAYSSQDSGGRLSGYDLSVPSVAMGADYNFGKVLLGVAVIGSWPDYDSNEADVDGKDITGLLYGGIKLPLNLDLGLLLGFGYTDYEQSRQVAGSGINADYHSNNFIVGAGLSRAFALNENFVLRPLASYEYLHLKVSGYDEGMGTNNLNIDGYTQGIHRLKAGLEFEYVANNGIQAGARAYYQGMYGDREGMTHVFFNADPLHTPLAASGNPVDENSLGLGVFGELPFTDSVCLSLGYDFLVGADVQSHQGSVSLKVAF